jgi:hypothetical protein
MTWDDQLPLAIHKASLLAKSPDGVYEELALYGAYQLEHRYVPIGEELELALLGRTDRLIHLGLAQFGAYKKVAQALYKDTSTPGGDADYKLAIRLAVLGNPRLPMSDFRSDAGFGALDEEQLAKVVKQGEYEEYKAVVCNPGGQTLLARMFNRKAPFDAIDDARFIRLLEICCTNPALTIRDDDEFGPDMTSWDLQKGLLNLVKTLAVNEKSLEALYWLLLNINPNHASNPKEDPRPMLDRWRKLELTERLTKYAEHIGHTSLNLRDEFICLAASLYGQVHADKEFKVVGSLNDPDQVMRCCYYGHTTLKGKELKQAYDRDKEVFVFATMQNISMPTSPEVRALIEKEMAGMQMIRLYYSRLKQSKERWGGEVKAATEWGAGLMEDLIKQPPPEIQRIKELEAQVGGLSKQLKTISTIVQWSLIGVVVVVVMMLWRHS